MVTSPEQVCNGQLPGVTLQPQTASDAPLSKRMFGDAHAYKEIRLKTVTAVPQLEH